MSALQTMTDVDVIQALLAAYVDREGVEGVVNAMQMLREASRTARLPGLANWLDRRASEVYEVQ